MTLLGFLIKLLNNSISFNSMFHKLIKGSKMKGSQPKSEAYLEPKRASIIIMIIIIIIIIIINIFHAEKYKFLLQKFTTL